MSENTQLALLGFHLVDRRRRIVATIPWCVAVILELAIRLDLIQIEFDRWHRERLWLRCRCRRIRHVHASQTTHLHLNPRQTIQEHCTYCDRTGSRAIHATVASPSAGVHRRPRRFQATRELTGARNRVRRVKRHGAIRSGGSSGSGISRQARLRQTVIRILEMSCLNTAIPGNGPVSILDRILNTCSLLKFEWTIAGRTATLADVVAAPSPRCRLDPEALNRQLSQNWGKPTLKATGWIFAVVRQVRWEERIAVVTIPWPRSNIAGTNGGTTVDPQTDYVFRVRSPRVVTRGPYLVAINCEFDSSGIPVAREAVILPIASAECPVPVESSYERTVALFLWRRGIPFLKPLSASGARVRPDFVLLSAPIVIEVQGVQFAGYTERKHLAHANLLDAPDYAGYELVLWNPNDGERFEVFVQRLKKKCLRIIQRARARNLPF